MQIAPHTKDEWIAFALFPFKVFTVAFLLILGCAPRSEFLPAVAFAFVLCLPVLLLGALIQGIFCERGSASRTLIFVCLILVLMFGDFRWGLPFLLIALMGWLAWRIFRNVGHHKGTFEDLTECVACHAIIPKGESQCSLCGWTYKT
jgi:hypothetical protein